MRFYGIPCKDLINKLFVYLSVLPRFDLNQSTNIFFSSNQQQLQLRMSRQAESLSAHRHISQTHIQSLQGKLAELEQVYIFWRGGGMFD